MVFEFNSEGPKGLIRKIIQFEQTNEPDVYNLAFGDLNSGSNELDDLAILNNGDGEKVLATVVAAFYVFFDKHPWTYVFATGSTNARTRLYRMGISRFYGEMILDFELYG